MFFAIVRLIWAPYTGPLPAETLVPTGPLNSLPNIMYPAYGLTSNTVGLTCCAASGIADARTAAPIIEVRMERFIYSSFVRSVDVWITAPSKAGRVPSSAPREDGRKFFYLMYLR